MGHVFSDMEMAQSDYEDTTPMAFQLGHVFSDMEMPEDEQETCTGCQSFNWATSFQTWK